MDITIEKEFNTKDYKIRVQCVKADFVNSGTSRVTKEFIQDNISNSEDRNYIKMVINNMVVAHEEDFLKNPVIEPRKIKDWLKEAKQKVEELIEKDSKWKTR